jgi:hypothetical protein
MEKLADLIVSESDFAEEELTRVLQPFVRFTDRGELALERRFDELPSEAQVACVLLALKALEILGLRPDDSASPADICEVSGLPGGTVRPKLSALLRKRCVRRGDDGRYSVPISLSHRTAEVVTNAA